MKVKFKIGETVIYQHGQTWLLCTVTGGYLPPGGVTFEYSLESSGKSYLWIKESEIFEALKADK
jgi:hypothetical protein